MLIVRLKNKDMFIKRTKCLTHSFSDSSLLQAAKKKTFPRKAKLILRSICLSYSRFCHHSSYKLNEKNGNFNPWTTPTFY